jgi:transcription antitermination protein NusB
VGAGAGIRTQQGRRCRAGSACNAADQAAVESAAIMNDDKKNRTRKPLKAPERKANRRGAARLAAVQALYQMDIAGAGINDIFAEFESHWLGNEVEGDKYLPAEAAFFRDVVSGVVRDQAKLDPLIDEALSRGWPLKRIDAILRAVLRAGAYELEHRKDVPGRVVVSEYVDVAHAFVEAEETGMVNAVLDQIARQFRGSEFVRAGG